MKAFDFCQLLTCTLQVTYLSYGKFIVELKYRQTLLDQKNTIYTKIRIKILKAGDY